MSYVILSYVTRLPGAVTHAVLVYCIRPLTMVASGEEERVRIWNEVRPMVHSRVCGKEDVHIVKDVVFEHG